VNGRDAKAPEGPSDVPRGRLLKEVAVAGVLGALAGIEFCWQVARTGAVAPAPSGDGWAAKLLLTLLLHSGALMSALIGFVVADSSRLHGAWRDGIMSGTATIGSAAAYALTWFMLRTGVGALRWRRVATVVSWVVWIALTFQFATLIDSRLTRP
jgi:hypothetical protein